MLVTCLVLGGCSFFEAKPQLRGNHVDADQLKELVPGTTTRADVTALIGSPTARATFDDNTWLYVSEVTRRRIARTDGVLSQKVVVLSFNDQGVLQDVKQVNQDEAVPVSIVARSTPSPGTEASFLQQLFGNIGRFNAIGPNPTAPSGGASVAASCAATRGRGAGLLSRRRGQPRAGRPVPDDQRRRDHGRRHNDKIQRRPAAGRLDRP
jgi:outer membrane protein assembly factor BamE (lipoprotein component of BamABCDE complex)